MKKTVFVVLSLFWGSLVFAQSDGHADFFDLEGYAPKLVHFKGEEAAWELAKKGPVLYYFAATWCPDCRNNYEDLKANLYRLPSDLTVVFVDYDSSAELKKKYGIPLQDVFVQINERGEKVKLWVSGGSRGISKNLQRSGR